MSITRVIAILKQVIDFVLSMFKKKSTPVIESVVETSSLIALDAKAVDPIYAPLMVADVLGMKFDILIEEIRNRVKYGHSWSDIEKTIIKALKPVFGPDRAFKRAQKIKERVGV